VAGAAMNEWLDRVFTAAVSAGAAEPKTDVVNKPPHYTRGKYETIDVIEDWQLDFHLGNAVKYISRAGHKDPSKTVEDLEKARWYISRAISRLRGAK
jgi:hypothetical protein